MRHLALFATIFIATYLTNIVFVTFVTGCVLAGVGLTDFVLSLFEDRQTARRMRRLSNTA